MEAFEVRYCIIHRQPRVNVFHISSSSHVMLYTAVVTPHRLCVYCRNRIQSQPELAHCSPDIFIMSDSSADHTIQDISLITASLVH